jgi:C-methyltransferase-like protein/methyltransferase family protein/putative zinc binding protein
MEQHTTTLAGSRELKIPEQKQRMGVTVVDRCRACGDNIQAFMSLGRQPAAQVLVDPTEQRDQFTYELKPAVCYSCCLLQLIEVPAPEFLFCGTYPYFTGTSRAMAEHFRDWADALLQRELAIVSDPFVVEIGSNDGTFLLNMARAGVRHLGVEPAASVAQVARERGVSVLETFFNARTATQIRAKHGPADVISAANVIAHIPAINDVAGGISVLLNDDGIFTFEAIYLGDLVRNTLLDQLYDEHVFTFSVQSVYQVFSRFGLELIDVEHQETHGGSIRYTLAHKGRRPVSKSVEKAIEEEHALGLYDPRTYEQFASRARRIRDRFLNLLRDLRAKGKRIAGYGATAKSTTILNYCGIDSRLVDYIADSTPMKQGKLTSGTHIMVRSPAYFAEDKPDYTVLLAWNHRNEIESKEAEYRQAGGKWIVYVPEVAVI